MILTTTIGSAAGQESYIYSSRSQPSSLTEKMTRFHRFHPFKIAKQTLNKSKSIMIRPPGTKGASPLFCRLEDQINKGNAIQCRFRLGSLSYVNYLEQKGDHQRLLLERIQRQ